MTNKEMAVNWIRSQGWNEENLPSDELLQMETAYLAGLKAGRPKWHKVADGDLPAHEVNVLVLYNVQCIDIAHYNYDYKEWHFTDSIVRDVIAWCEIPKYTEE